MNVNINAALKELPALFGALFVAILFIQSGMDKVLDWKGNLEFLTAHFAKTFAAGMVAPMLAVITVLELATGSLAVAGIFYLVFTGSASVIFYCAVAGATALTALFFGQRIAKDYPGAAVIVPYFLLVAALMLLTNPYAVR
jgi:hypothetical protein